MTDDISSTSHGEARNEEAYKALDALNSFASIGVQHFDVTFTDLDGKKPAKGGFLANRDTNGLRPTLGAMLQLAALRQQNVIIRPHNSPRASIIQLDDLDAQKARRFEHLAFLTLQTSPGSYQAWVAVSDPEPDFARRLRRGAGADPTASGATRIPGSRNFKRKYAPEFPTVEITGRNTGQLVTMAELEQAGLVAPKEQPRTAPPTASDRQRFTGRPPAWPNWQKCLDGAPESQSRPGQNRESMADFTWCIIAIRWGHSAEATAEKLMDISPKARENGQHYATQTAWRAAEEAAQGKRTR